MSKRERKGTEKPASLETTPAGYAEWLADLKHRIHAAQQRAALAVNRELVILYWQLGRDILDRQAQQGWGAKVVERLAQDLKVAFPEMKGFSPRNLMYMRRFAEAWPDQNFVQQAAAQLPWFHLCTLLDKVKDPGEREWYLNATAQHNWSRAVLVMQIETGAIRRFGNALTNFEQQLPKPQSDLARETLKDPYRFDFLGLGSEAIEREVERALVKHVVTHQRRRDDSRALLSQAQRAGGAVEAKKDRRRVGCSGMHRVASGIGVVRIGMGANGGNRRSLAACVDEQLATRDASRKAAFDRAE